LMMGCLNQAMLIRIDDAILEKGAKRAIFSHKVFIFVLIYITSF